MTIMSEILKNELKSKYIGCVEFNIPLNTLSRWKVGGIAEIVITPCSKIELIDIVKFARINHIPTVIIGATSNLLFSDEGVDALIIKIGENFSDFEVRDNVIIAQSGLWAPKLSRIAQQNMLTGLEHICGIPGTLGGLVFMNGGSQRKGIGSSVFYVETVDKYGNLKRYNKENCEFYYRTSVFQNSDEVIVEVALELEQLNNKRTIRQEMLGILRSRREKFPQKEPNCGSVFVSNPSMYSDYGPPGKVIEDCGLKGLRRNGAQVSENHANFIVNNGEATAKDILYLINQVRTVVHRETGYLMNVEVRYVDKNGGVGKLC